MIFSPQLSQRPLWKALSHPVQSPHRFTDAVTAKQKLSSRALGSLGARVLTTSFSVSSQPLWTELKTPSKVCRRVWFKARRDSSAVAEVLGLHKVGFYFHASSMTLKNKIFGHVYYCALFGLSNPTTALKPAINYIPGIFHASFLPFEKNVSV